MLAEHETESARQQMAAEARASEAEAVARETLVKHQVDTRTTCAARTRTLAYDARTYALARPICRE